MWDLTGTQRLWPILCDAQVPVPLLSEVKVKFYEAWLVQGKYLAEKPRVLCKQISRFCWKVYENTIADLEVIWIKGPECIPWNWCVCLFVDLYLTTQIKTEVLRSRRPTSKSQFLHVLAMYKPSYFVLLNLDGSWFWHLVLQVIFEDNDFPECDQRSQCFELSFSCSQKSLPSHHI